MGRYLLLLFILITPWMTYSQVDIRLFYGEPSNAVVLRVASGQYSIMVNGSAEENLSPGDIVFVHRSDTGGVIVNFTDRPDLAADSLIFNDRGGNSSFSLRRPGDKNQFVEYEGSLKMFNGLGSLLIINTLEMERYIAAVVQAEGGFRAHNEYFKTQAVITRTYAWLHMNKHRDEGYDLCDDVHCQVYHGRSFEQPIIDAVKETAGLVITDADSNLILTPFHSNCGGETVAAEEVWLTGKPYLQPVTDPYCSFSRNARWEKKIARTEWLDYLKSNGYDGGDDKLLPYVMNSRQRLYRISDFSIPATSVRGDLGLRSAFFSVIPEGDSVIIRGRGYGHGVGLCQEGAMVLATRGFSFASIISFYYQDVRLIDISFTAPPVRGIDTF